MPLPPKFKKNQVLLFILRLCFPIWKYGWLVLYLKLYEFNERVRK